MVIDGRDSRGHSVVGQPGPAASDSLQQWVGQRVSVSAGGVYGQLLVPAHYEGLVTGVLTPQAGTPPMELMLRVKFDNGKQAVIRADELELAPVTPSWRERERRPTQPGDAGTAPPQTRT